MKIRNPNVWNVLEMKTKDSKEYGKLSKTSCRQCSECLYPSVLQGMGVFVVTLSHRENRDE